jgi:hypothetical protein
MVILYLIETEQLGTMLAMREFVIKTLLALKLMAIPSPLFSLEIKR